MTMLRQEMTILSLLPAAALLLGPGAASADDIETNTDLEISDAVADELISDPAVNGLKIDVSADQGIVTLAGQVSNLLAEHRACKIAETVRGVRAVVDRIEVRPLETVTDAMLTERVEAALLFNPATDSYEIAVEVHDAGATLSGSVDSWTEKDLAHHVAMGVDGLMTLRNEIRIAPPESRSDAEIARELREMYRWDVNVDGSLLEVAVADAGVTLSGAVGSAAERSHAIRRAWVPGVERVDAEDLEVEGWARDERFRRGKYEARSDKELHRAIELAMLYDPRVNSQRVEATVEAGAVTLRGRVESLEAQRAAMQDARNVVGVHRVTDRMIVRLEAWPSDESVASAIVAAYVRDPFVESGEVAVAVRDGVVRLHGTVDTGFEKAQAEELATRARGVVRVRNNLEVRDADIPLIWVPHADEWSGDEFEWPRYETYPTYTRADSEIEADIESELYWSPYVDSEDISVEVEDGVATLRGVAGSFAEARYARENAFEGGALRVVDEMSIERLEKDD